MARTQEQKNQPLQRMKPEYRLFNIPKRECARAKGASDPQVKSQKCPTNYNDRVKTVTDVRALEYELLRQPSFCENVLYLLGKAS